jgi:hypothetical protein
MIMKKTFFAIISVSVLLVSCGGSETSKPSVVTTTVTTDEVSTTPGNWEYDHSSTAVKWTGYKLASKAGVSGGFDSIKVVGFSSGPDPAAAMTGVQFEISTQSINSNDSIRDGNLANILFGGMNTPMITGEIKSIDEVEGTAIVSVNMAGFEMDVPMAYAMSAENVVKLLWQLDNLPNWSDDAQVGFDAIAEACKEKHEGVTHPDVEIKVFTKLKWVE